MPKKVAITNLQASTIDIMNVIRQNAGQEYQDLVPEVTRTTDIPKVGEIIMGYPALANKFISSLMNRIAQVRVKSALFNNPYSSLKKGYLEFGETVEEVFVQIAKAREFSAEKAADRELRRSLPDVRTAFHCMNWRVDYPITIQNDDLKMAFLTENGLTDMIAKLVDSLYRAAEYDEFLLVKYLIIKAVSHGKMYPVSYDANNSSQSAIEFRAISNLLTFMKTQFNAEGVTTTTAREDQIIFMDSRYNATFDVEVLAGAFNMDKADFMGRLFLIDDFTSFDNDRFDVIRANSTMIEEVTAEELALMSNVKAIILDREWFQLYDELSKFNEKFVAAGDYWNYFYLQWKTISSSPFSNAVVFLDSSAPTELPASITVEITDKLTSEAGTIFTLTPQNDTPALSSSAWLFTQTQQAVEAGIAVHKYGAYVFPATATTTTPEMSVNGTVYTSAEALTPASEVGATLTFNKAAARKARARKAIEQ